MNHDSYNRRSYPLRFAAFVEEVWEREETAIFSLKVTLLTPRTKTEVFIQIRFKAVMVSEYPAVIKMRTSNISVEELGMIPNLIFGSNA